MVSNESMAGMVIAGRGARACDMCGKERARWYCAADEAYLCESCDRSVHSANAVARRHERAKLGPNGAPMKIKPSHNHHRKIKTINLSSLQHNPALQFPKIGAHHKWWRSSKKRSRTPRKSLNPTGQSFITVNPTLTPEMINTAIIKEEKEDAILLYDLLTADDQFGELPTTATFGVKPEPFSHSPTSASRGFLDLKSEESELAHEVPTYEPLLQELIAAGHGELMEKILPSSPSFCNTNCTSRDNDTSKLELTPLQTSNYTEATVIKDGSAPSKIETDALQSYDLVEGSVVEDGSISINGDSDIDTFDVMDLCSNANLYDDMKGDELREEFPDMEMWQAAYQGACPNMYGGNPFIGKGERELEMGCVKVEGLLDAEGKSHHQRQQQPGYKKFLSLRLDYEEVLNAWSDRGSLWTDGQRPQTVPDICSLDQENVECGMMVVGESSCNSSSCQAGQVPVLAQVDSGREARVLRYKEKRRTRLFSKKIRYEVRKLNAERRPRMKGRFVKRSAIAGM